MSEGNTTKELIIWKAYRLLREKGYHHTSMADIGNACGLLKGSIYHYFASKEDLMVQVLEAVHRLFKKEVFSQAFSTTAVPKERLQKMLAAIEYTYFEEEGGCLMGQTGSQVGDRIPAFAHIIKQFFQDWIEAFTHLFKLKYEQEQAIELAKQAVIEIEGAITLYCIFLDKTYFIATRQRIQSLLS